ncbi:MAG: hypothetical protein U0271_36485 [Polyangiaceae bacterium]
MGSKTGFCIVGLLTIAACSKGGSEPWHSAEEGKTAATTNASTRAVASASATVAVRDPQSGTPKPSAAPTASDPLESERDRLLRELQAAQSALQSAESAVNGTAGSARRPTPSTPCGCKRDDPLCDC